MSRQLAAMLGDIAAEQLFGTSEADIAIRTGRNTTRVSERIDYLAEPALKARADADRMHGHGHQPQRRTNPDVHHK